MKRFEGDFSGDQARILAHEFDIIWRRTLLIILVLFIGVAAGYGYAIHRVGQAERVNIQNARDLANASAKLAYDNCVRAQQGRQALALIVHTAIPRHQPNASPQQRAFTEAFYGKLAKHHALTIPTCVHPRP